ncbi:DRTGG domain-containing protein [Candidatus Neomarinimicrobiota bacterium]
MKKYIFTSLNKNAGKTGIIIGLGKAINQKIGYLKPFGDRLLYRKKRLWDYDSAVISKIFNIEESPEGMTLGFDHSKLRYMYDENNIIEKIKSSITEVPSDTDVLFIESGKNNRHGVTVNLDALTIAKATDARLIVVVSGDSDDIADDILYFKQHTSLKGIDFAGVVVNKVKDVDDFKMVYEDILNKFGINILGVIPYEAELTYPSVQLISDMLMAKVISGEKVLDQVVRDVFVGAMSGDAAQRVEKFKNKNKLIITAGDRSDMILAAIETQCVGIILTNDILPQPNIIALASEKNVPLLLVHTDTHKAAKKIDQMVPLVDSTDMKKIGILEDSIKNYTTLVDLM